MLATWAGADFATASATPIDGREPGHELPPGTRVERYQILGLVGRGGMGEVYAAYHPDLDRRIALKIVYGARASDPDRQRQLLREARIIARLSHPNIVSVYDAGMVGEQVYVAMEFVDGQTLDAWLREKPRRCQEIVDVLVAAGRGLAAAHAANVVHRDFKPQNVMIGRDGRVRVMDFGVARPLLERIESAPVVDASPCTAEMDSSTTAGALVGTPAYMSPEQLRGQPIDVRADQFSFCVALHEAVQGVRPGVSPSAAGSRGRRPPAWLRAVLRKGLELDRSDRYPSMHHLLRAIERGRGRRARRIAWVGLAGALALIGGFGVRALHLRRFACVPPASRVQAAWDLEERPGSNRARLHDKFRSSSLAGGEAIWQRLTSALDDRIREWSGMYQDACEATHVRGDQSPEVLDLRMTCLGDVLDGTRAFTDELLVAKEDVLERALSTVNALPAVRQCADIKNLRLKIPLPEDLAVRAQVEQLQQRMNDADVLIRFNHAPAAEKALRAILPAARQLGFKPLVAQVLEKLAQAECELFRLEDADRFAQEALAVAEASQDDLTAAQAVDAIGWVALQKGRLEEAEHWFAFGDAVIDRLHARGSLVDAWFQNEWSLLYLHRGEMAAAERAQRESLRLKISLLGPRHPDVGISLGNLGVMLDEMGRLAEAQAQIRAALDIAQQYIDRSSPAAINYILGEAEVLLHMGRLDEAERALSDALVAIRKQPEEDLVAGVALMDQADLLLARHRPAEALQAVTHAQTILARGPIGLPTWTGGLEFTRARALIDSGAETEDALRLLADACLIFDRLHLVRRHRDLLGWWNGLPRRAGGAPAASCADLPRGPQAARSAPPPVGQLQQDHVGGRAVAEGPR